jgi:hypothetical protein
MHGEYKPRGGKLVAADVEVAAGRVTRAQVSGDFSPAPGSTLGRVNAAVTGIPVTADESVIAARVKAALGSDAVLAGFTAAAVATAVRRALTRASGWRDHDWRLIREEPQAPALHMGAMFVEPASMITYSLYAPGSLVAGMSHAESYAYLDDWVVGALTEDLGPERGQAGRPAAPADPSATGRDLRHPGRAFPPPLRPHPGHRHRRRAARRPGPGPGEVRRQGVDRPGAMTTPTADPAPCLRAVGHGMRPNVRGADVAIRVRPAPAARNQQDPRVSLGAEREDR